jgi:hypothetical protein
VPSVVDYQPPLRQPRYPAQVDSQWGLVHAWALNLGGPRVVDSAPLRAAATFGVGPTLPTGNYWRTDEQGNDYILWDNTGTGDVASTDIALGDSSGTGSPGSTVFSFFCRLYLGSVGANQSIYGTDASNGLQIRISTGNKIQALKAGVASMGTSTTSLAANTWYAIGVTYDGATVRFFLNGAPDGSASSAQTFTHSQQYYVGRRNSAERPTNGFRLQAMYVSRQVWGDGAFRRLHDNPWQVFEPEPIHIYWPSAGGGPTYTLAADGATFTLAGQVTGLKAARKMVAASATFALTGQDVALKAARKLVAGNGAFALTGTAAALKAARKLSSESGAFALSGQDVTLTYSGAASPTYTLAAGSGAFVVTGGAVNLTAQRLLSAAGGIFVLTGQSVDLIYSGTESVSAAASDLDVGEQRRAFNAADQSRRLNITRQSRRLNVRRG